MKDWKPELRRQDFTRPAAVARKVRAKSKNPADLSRAVQAADELSYSKGVGLARGILKSCKDKTAYEQDARQLVHWAKGRDKRQMRLVSKAVIAEGGAAGSLFLIHNISGMKKSEARPFMKSYLDAGGEIEPVAEWLRLAGKTLREHNVKSNETAGFVVDAVEWIGEKIEEGIDALLESIEAIVDAIIEAGIEIFKVIYAVAKWTAEQLLDLFQALLEAGIKLVEIMVGVFKIAYAAAANAVRALLKLGFTVADLLIEAVDQTYWAFRRVVYGILDALGPVGDVLEFVLDQVASVTDELWKKALQAIRYAKKTLSEVIDWAIEKSIDVVEAVVRAWEEAGEALIDLYRYLADKAIDIWEQLGEITMRIGNSVHYVLEFLKEDLIPGIFKFVKGVLRIGFAVASLIAWAIEQSVEIIGEVLKAALEIGATLGTLIAETIAHPHEALQNFLKAADSIGKTLKDVYRAVIVETAEEFLEEVTLALKEIGNSIVDMLEAVYEIAGGALGTVISVLLNTLGTYRPMTANEKSDARKVFKDKLDYSTIYLAEESVTNDIIFGIQDFFTGNPDSRAFVTFSLINFDVDEGIERHTLIHELTHVWQAEYTGPFYLVEAAEAQMLGAGYDYGYDPDDDADMVSLPVDYAGTKSNFYRGRVTGEGAQTELQNANGDLEKFNREQQAQIVMHYFVRKELLGMAEIDYADWQPYIDYIRAAA